MRTIFRYLKPYWVSIALVILLLFIQANADLSLPDYLSNIVNVGIQQGGIEPDIPRVIRTGSFEAFGRLMQAEGAGEKFAVLQKVYELASPGSDQARMLSKKWPLANSQLVMSLNLSDKAGIEAARQVFLAEYPKLVVISQLPDMAAADAAGASAGTAADAAKALGGAMTGGQIPGSQIPGALAALSPQAILAQIDSLDPRAKSQIVVRGLQKEFEALGVDMAALQTGYILNIGAIMLVITLISVAATIMVGYLGSRVAAGTARDLRRAVFAKVEDFSLAEFDSFSTASLITRSTNDVTQVQMMIMMGMRMLFYAPIIGIGGVVRALGKASGMWWIIAAAVGVLIGIIGLVFALVVPKFRAIQKLVDRLNLVVRENLSGMMVIRAFNRQDHEVQRFDRANRDLAGTMLQVTRVMVVLMPLMTLIMNVVSISIIWVGSHEVAAGSIRVGDMMAFMQYSMQIFFAFLMMSFMFIMLPRASVSADRIAEVVTTPVSIRNPEIPTPLPRPVRGEIEFRNVRFRYPGAQEDVLHDISFTARPGTTTAIIGTTGSGKSTLVSLIPRLYDASEGAVLFDGIDIRTLALSELRDAIGFVPQKSMLFSGSIADNVRYGKDGASEEEVRQALELAQIWSLAEESPEGLGHKISQGGMNVSGGQRQRLAIARALVRRSPVYIFDECFSALDYRTERAIREALKAHARDSTVFLVSQRVAPIRHAEQIIVLDDGHVVGIGKHEELMKTCDVYRDIALSQLKQEELA